MEPQHDLAAELELVSASLLPSEILHSHVSADHTVFTVTSSDSQLSLSVTVGQGFPKKESVAVEIKGGQMGRDEAAGWIDWVQGKLDDWDEDQDYPLYEAMTTHFLPLLAPVGTTPSPPPSKPPALAPDVPAVPHHALMVSHHLLAPSKRKDLHALSSSLSLIGFSKTGHPGIMYAIGDLLDLEEWIREVKSWQWLALRVRLAPLPVPEEAGNVVQKGQETGARGGKGRGEWSEMEKVGEALEWLRKRGGEERAKVLTDIGIGAGGGKG
ncbi:hypothetical protein L202_02077 [Cryptococcus amylolentus CBS 6039]|uniref:Uncharacterized protein n=2 Tax=Cryptococcus amylolentus TaxID=104669 RepID=A0A1E3HZB2_9TREE|nr:hypothetical protein L202_02077 [Cryptococcus amylolentus CBS 6039]ODN81680.1 hypothetical protein L202_02077 [Cryptococcus amylolentus CBS 6039]ODO10114.1 hypothetical protein I350_02342 [Cryptococcus amylolentus CBS 6273]